MKNHILTMCSVWLIAGSAAALAWHDHGYYNSFPYQPGWMEETRPGLGYRARVHVEKEVYDEGYLVRVYAVGIKPQDIEVTVDRGRLRLRTEMGARRDWQDEYRRSRVSGYSYFSRNISLPYDADPGKMVITATDDVLEIMIPRR